MNVSVSSFFMAHLNVTNKIHRNLLIVQMQHSINVIQFKLLIIRYPVPTYFTSIEGLKSESSISKSWNLKHKNCNQPHSKFYKISKLQPISWWTTNIFWRRNATNFDVDDETSYKNNLSLKWIALIVYWYFVRLFVFASST